MTQYLFFLDILGVFDGATTPWGPAKWPALPTAKTRALLPGLLL